MEQVCVKIITDDHSVLVDQYVLDAFQNKIHLLQ